MHSVLLYYLINGPDRDVSTPCWDNMMTRHMGNYKSRCKLWLMLVFYVYYN